MSLDDRNDILQEIAQERLRQDEKWGIQDHPDGTGDFDKEEDYYRQKCNESFKNGYGTWKDIFLEEVYEALNAKDANKLEEELIQVAAVAVSWLESIKRKKK